MRLFVQSIIPSPAGRGLGEGHKIRRNSDPHPTRVARRPLPRGEAFFRAVSWLLILTLVLTSLPATNLIPAAVARQKKAQPKLPPPPRNVKVNRTVPTVAPIAPVPVLCPSPKDEDLVRARVV